MQHYDFTNFNFYSVSVYHCNCCVNEFMPPLSSTKLFWAWVPPLILCSSRWKWCVWSLGTRTLSSKDPRCGEWFMSLEHIRCRTCYVPNPEYEQHAANWFHFRKTLSNKNANRQVWLYLLSVTSRHLMLFTGLRALFMIIMVWIKMDEGCFFFRS